MTAAHGQTGHAALMDATYRYQRFVYDATRRYFLLGRDQLIDDLAPPLRGRILEIGCGTGRNLARVAERYPGRRLYGLDISAEMLRTAEAKLADAARLARADACGFVANDIFGVTAFDRIILSYCLSMIPGWMQAVENAARHLAPAGELHIVDFGANPQFPGIATRALYKFLARFHVEPRTDLAGTLDGVAARIGGKVRHRRMFAGYALYSVLANTDRSGEVIHA